MALGNILKFNKKNPTTENKFKINDIDYSNVLYTAIIMRMIDDVLTNLTNEDLFSKLDSADYPLRIAMFNLFNNGGIKAKLLLSKGTAVNLVDINSQDDYKTLSSVPLDITIPSKQLSTVIRERCESLSMLINSNSDSILLDKAILFNIKDFRNSASSDKELAITDQFKMALEGIKNGYSTSLILDKEDIVSTLGTSLANTYNIQLKNIVSELVLLTGYSENFFTGSFKHELGGTTEPQEANDLKARKSFYDTYLKVFFHSINKEITIKNKLTANIPIQTLLEIASYDDDIVDKIAIYKELGIPLKAK